MVEWEGEGQGTSTMAIHTCFSILLFLPSPLHQFVPGSLSVEVLTLALLSSVAGILHTFRDPEKAPGAEILVLVPGTEVSHALVTLCVFCTPTLGPESHPRVSCIYPDSASGPPRDHTKLQTPFIGAPGVGPGNLYFAKLFRLFGCQARVKNHSLDQEFQSMTRGPILAYHPYLQIVLLEPSHSLLWYCVLPLSCYQGRAG